MFYFNTFSKFNKYFFKKNKYSNGRSKKGAILVRHRCQKLVRDNISIDYKRMWSDQQAILIAIKLKVSNNTYITLIKYSNGSMSFIPLTHGLLLGYYINTQPYLYRLYNQILIGKVMPLKLIKRFSLIFNVSIYYKNSGVYARSSGTHCNLLKSYKDFNLVRVKLPSGKRYVIDGDCFATLGRNTNLKKKYQVIGSAGYSRLLGKKSSVRGVAMNPVDHPHGGRTKSNSPEVSPWGWVTKFSH